jgi:hypothetical protein
MPKISNTPMDCRALTQNITDETSKRKLHVDPNRSITNGDHVRKFNGTPKTKTLKQQPATTGTIQNGTPLIESTEEPRPTMEEPEEEDQLPPITEFNPDELNENSRMEMESLALVPEAQSLEAMESDEQEPDEADDIPLHQPTRKGLLQKQRATTTPLDPIRETSLANRVSDQTTARQSKTYLPEVATYTMDCSDEANKSLLKKKYTIQTGLQ